VNNLVQQTTGFLGSLGSYSNKAAKILCPDEMYESFETFDSLVKAVECQEVHKAVLPIENSFSGRIPEVHRLILTMELYITAELLLDVNHCLIGSPNVSIDRIEKILSHPQGFIQSSEFLSLNYPSVERKSCSDTSSAVKYVVESSDPNIAAIGSEFASNIYGGRVIRKGISNRSDNITRFILVSNELVIQDSDDISSHILQVKHEPGSLVKALEIFGENEINITKLDTYMVSEQTRVPTFYLDLGCGGNDLRLIRTFESIRPFITYSKILGSYKADKRRSGENGFLVP